MRLRVGVIGGGLIAQVIHLPNLVRLADRFELVAVADPSPTVVEALARRYGASAHLDWRLLLEAPDLDAVLLCSPNHTHAEIALTALDAGIHVFVEKPLCLDPADAHRIVERGRRTGTVVQVGYMKRFDPAFESLIAHLPDAAVQLRLVDVVTSDPWMAREPFVPWSAMVHADDVDPRTLAEGRDSERAQVAAAVGIDDPVAVRAYVDTFLGALIHDVNLVNGVLDRLDGGIAAHPVGAAWWNRGRAASVALELPDGARWTSAWMLQPGLQEFREEATFHFDDAIHRLTFPAPYFVGTPAVHEHAMRSGDEARTIRHATQGDPYVAELVHLHQCIVDGARCRTPAEQGARDVALLADLFVAAGSTGRPVGGDAHPDDHRLAHVRGRLDEET